MGDVRFTPRQTAALLDKLDEGLKSLAEARRHVIEAMAERRRKPTADAPPSRARVRLTRAVKR
jgi:hypothetical protein